MRDRCIGSGNGNSIGSGMGMGHWYVSWSSIMCIMYHVNHVMYHCHVSLSWINHGHVSCIMYQCHVSVPYTIGMGHCYVSCIIVMYGVSCINAMYQCHVSCHVSCISVMYQCHVPCIMYHWYVSCIMYHGHVYHGHGHVSLVSSSCIIVMYGVSCIMDHVYHVSLVSCIMYHHHASYHVSCHVSFIHSTLQPRD